MNKMSKTSKIVLSIAAFGVLVACTALLGCGQRGPVPVEVDEPLELRTYTVPAEYQEDLRTMLRSALEAEGMRIGRVTQGPGGTLLVVAPPRIQTGVRQILDKGFEVPPVPRPVELTYWLLVGRPLDPSRGTETFSVAGGRDLPRLEPALRRIAAAQGPAEFSLLEQIQLTSMNQARAHTAGSFARVTQRATKRGEQVVADVEISLGNNAFQSQVMLEVGQFLVLGQTGFAGKSRHAFADAGNEDGLTLYYVMAADLEP